MTAAQAQTMQVGAWLAAIVSAIVAIIVNRAKLGKFLRRWWKILAVVFGAAGLYVCYLRGWMDWIGDFSRWLSHPVAVPVWVYFSIVFVALGASTLVWFSIPFLKKLWGRRAGPRPLLMGARASQCTEPLSPTPSKTVTPLTLGSTSAEENKQQTIIGQSWLTSREPDAANFPPFWSALLVRMQALDPHIHVYLKEAKAVKLSNTIGGEALTIVFPFERPEHQNILLRLKNSMTIRDILLCLGYGGLQPRIEFLAGPKRLV